MRIKEGIKQSFCLRFPTNKIIGYDSAEAIICRFANS